MKEKKVFVSQSKNYAGDFGLVLRSSAIFYVCNNHQITTTISFMNYWFLRRNMKVAIVANTRLLDGTLVRREQLKFSRGMVVNYTAKESDFEGSIEIEVFCTENLVIPYAAIMAIYESKNSISMVHSYSRIYSNHEVEESRVISKGRESCWTIRDDDDTCSFCVMHNGANIQSCQNAYIIITKNNGERISSSITLPELGAYASYRINLQEHIKGLVDLLDGEAANASISFDLNGSFSRLLVGNERKSTGEFQVTHSNFNYLEHQTDFVEGDHKLAYMKLIELKGYSMRVIIYPDMQEGEYQLSDQANVIKFQAGDRVEYLPRSFTQKIHKKKSSLPTRVVTAICGEYEGKLSFECSLGVRHIQVPGKRMHWGLTIVDSSRSLTGYLFITAYKELYGELKEQSVNVRLYSKNKNEFIEKYLSEVDFSSLRQGVLITDIFEEAEEFLGNDYGYFSVYSDYPGFLVYSGIENGNNSLTIEHTF